MPTYDYVCEACNHEFELFQSIKADVERKCPECGRLKLKRLIGTGAGIIFKGSGFYSTDYRSESYKKAAAADKTNGAPPAPAKSDTASKSDTTNKSETSSKKDKPAGSKGKKSS